MAKQSGLHQIRGKVGEHSYYRQSGVSAGLIRQINQGMSQRVKTGEEYANTRLNNAEFGHSCAIAGVLGKSVSPKFRPMMLTFSQSKMARVILDAIKRQTGNWGQRSLPAGAVGRQALVDALSSVRKNDPAIYGVTVSTSTTNVTITTDITLSAAMFAAIGADKYLVTVLRNNIQVGNYVAALNGYEYTYRVWNSGSDTLTDDDTKELSITTPQIPVPTEGNANIFGLDVVVIMPVRTVNGEEHILQEYCTYLIS